MCRFFSENVDLQKIKMKNRYFFATWQYCLWWFFPFGLEYHVQIFLEYRIGFWLYARFKNIRLVRKS